MDDSWRSVSDKFKGNVRSVRSLVSFDRDVLEGYIGKFEEVATAVIERTRYDERLAITNRLDALRNLRTSGSMAGLYRIMLNQCVILLVSYLDSACQGLFRDAVVTALQAQKDVPIARRDWKLSWQSLHAHGPEGHASVFAAGLLSVVKVNGQDIWKVNALFEEHLGVVGGQGIPANDVAFGQAARHAIVHNNGIVDTTMQKQTKSLQPRQLFAELPPAGSPIAFVANDVTTLANGMETCFDALCEALSTQIGPHSHYQSAE